MKRNHLVKTLCATAMVATFLLNPALAALEEEIPAEPQEQIGAGENIGSEQAGEGANAGGEQAGEDANIGGEQAGEDASIGGEQAGEDANPDSEQAGEGAQLPEYNLLHAINEETPRVVSTWAMDDASLVISQNEDGLFAQRSGGMEQFSVEDGLTITGAGKSVVVESGVEMTLVLNGVTLQGEDGAALQLMGNANVTVKLQGENALSGAEKFAAIQVERTEEAEAALTITGEGTLEAQGGKYAAGIGGGFKGNGGSITIESGTINAQGNNGGAGIGGGYSDDTYQYSGSRYGDSGDITIDGGTVIAMGDKHDATHGKGGAGIGGGGNGYANSIIINNGSIKAYGGTDGAGIGSGDHASAEHIEINGGDIEAVGAYGAAGIGCGQGSHQSATSRGVGYYYADVTVNGGSIVAVSGDFGAGIGGGMYCDGIVNINGGDITATGGRGNPGSFYQGGAGIGGGYQGYCQITVEGGTIEATGGTGCPGIGLGAVALQENPYKAATSSDHSMRDSEGQKIAQGESFILISGGTITANGGCYAAGIGTGNSALQCAIEINGGDIKAYGGKDPEGAHKNGGAGIGSGVGTNGIAAEVGGKPAVKYAMDTTDLTIAITGDAKIYAEGAWGAAGIGSGAGNVTAATITVDGGADMFAVADGTKFAVDTARGSVQRSDTTNLVQGTFMMEYTGLTVVVAEDKMPESASDTVAPGLVVAQGKLPEGYRSFALTTANAGSYLVRDSENRYYVYNTNPADKNEVTNPQGAANTVHYVTDNSSLSDNYFLHLTETAPSVEVIYTVTFIGNGGSETPTQKVKENNTATEPADPTREGYTFGGWYNETTLETLYDFSTPVTQDIVLYAKWTEKAGGADNGTGDGGQDRGDDSDDEEAPTTPVEEEIIDPEVPLSETPETVPDDHEIELGDPAIPLAETPEEPEEVLEEPVPLADLPKTGGATAMGLALAGLTTIGVGAALRKKDEE